MSRFHYKSSPYADAMNPSAAIHIQLQKSTPSGLDSHSASKWLFGAAISGGVWGSDTDSVQSALARRAVNEMKSKLNAVDLENFQDMLSGVNQRQTRDCSDMSPHGVRRKQEKLLKMSKRAEQAAACREVA